MPEWIQINSLDASAHDAATAYVAATMYKWDDFKPYLYKTSDYGKTWKKITSGIPDGAFTRVIREDPNKRGLLYAGTETGLYLSFDDGEHWHSMQFNLPVVPITDLAVQRREKDLVAATQGRSFWVFDDLPLLHQFKDRGGYGAISETRLFRPEESYRMPGSSSAALSPTAAVGRNPASGLVVYYSLKSRPENEISLEFLDGAGKLIRKLTTKVARPEGDGAPTAKPSPPAEAEAGGGTPPPPRLTMEVGLNRFEWDLRHSEAVRFPGLILWSGELRGPRVVPGNYQMKLTVDGKVFQEELVVKADPRLSSSAADYAKQLDLSLKIRDKVSETHEAIVQIREVRRQIDDLLKRVKDHSSFKPVGEAGSTLTRNLTAIEETLYQTKNRSNQDPLNYPIRLNNKLAALGGVVSSGESAPTDQAYAVYDELVSQIDSELLKLNQLVKNDLPAFNQLVKQQNIPAVVVRPASVETSRP
jgi:hypothetical protein